jgi:DNA mismatch repair ATPase MutL
MKSSEGLIREVISEEYPQLDIKDLLRVEKQGFYVHLSGYVSEPGDWAASPNDQIIFVNGLRTKDPVLKKSIADAFRTSAKKGEYPYAFLYLTIKSYRLDMYPERGEVEYYDPVNVGAFCKDAALEALGLR